LEIGFLLAHGDKEIDLVAGRIMHLREGEFQLEGEIRLRVCWRRIAEKTEETSSKEIDLLSWHLQRPNFRSEREPYR
jgi:hypothetical protein